MRYLHCCRRRRRQPRDHGAPYQYTAKAWSLDDWDDTLAVDKTRFTKHRIRVLAIALKIGAVKWSYGIQPEPIMALVVTLMRLSWPRRLSGLSGYFGYSRAYLSRVVNDVCQHLIEQYHGLLQWHPRLRRYRVIRACARAVVDEGCPSRIWGLSMATSRHSKGLRAVSIYYIQGIRSYTEWCFRRLPRQMAWSAACSVPSLADPTIGACIRIAESLTGSTV
jgi:hypothetical protein